MHGWHRIEANTSINMVFIEILIKQHENREKNVSVQTITHIDCYVQVSYIIFVCLLLLLRWFCQVSCHFKMKWKQRRHKFSPISAQKQGIPSENDIKFRFIIIYFHTHTNSYFFHTMHIVNCKSIYFDRINTVCTESVLLLLLYFIVFIICIFRYFEKNESDSLNAFIFGVANTIFFISNCIWNFSL